MENCFNIGKIVNTHGIKGEVKIYPYTDDIEKFADFDYLYIEGFGKVKYKLQSARAHKGMVLVKFSEYNDINQIAAFINKNVYIERQDAPDDGEGHYIVDLIGCEIYDESGEKLGVLKDVLQNSAQDLYEINRVQGGVFLLPVVDEFVKKIDIKNKKIIVHLIEGMLE